MMIVMESIFGQFNVFKPSYKNSNMKMGTLPILGILAIVLIAGCTQTGQITSDSSPSQPSGEQIPVCTPNWQCGDWSSCSPNGRQIRTCTDINNCGSNTGKPTTIQSCEYKYGIGDAVTIGNLQYNVTDAFTSPLVGSGLWAEFPKGSYVVIIVEIENVGKESEFISSGVFSLTDSQDRKYDVDSASFYLSYMGFNVILFDNLGPGLTTRGSILFDVPKDDTGLRLKITGGWLSSTKEYIEIGDVADLEHVNVTVY